MIWVEIAVGAIALCGLLLGLWNYRIAQQNEKVSTEIQQAIADVQSDVAATLAEQLDIERGREHRELAPNLSIRFVPTPDRTPNGYGYFEFRCAGQLSTYSLTVEILADRIKPPTAGLGTGALGVAHQGGTSGWHGPPLIYIGFRGPQTVQDKEFAADGVYKRIDLGDMASGETKRFDAQPDIGATGGIQRIRVLASSPDADGRIWPSHYTFELPTAADIRSQRAAGRES